MMEGAFFVGRVELLNWLNDLLKLDYTKVEQACTGAAYCQIMDAIYPGKVPVSKINFGAKHEYEWVANFKILQNAFDKLAIDKYIDVAKLVKGRYQDNLEFLQWIKRYFDLNYSGGEYNAVERRNLASKGGSPSSGISAPPKKATTTTAAPTKKVTTEAPKKTTTTSVTKTATTAPAKIAPARVKVASKSPEPKPKPTEDDGKIQELTQTIAELKATIDGVEKERDFYFSKLREIELLCQSSPEADSKAIQDISKILYAESEGFVQQGEEGEQVTEEIQEGGEEQVEEQAEEQQPEEEIESF